MHRSIRSFLFVGALSFLAMGYMTTPAISGEGGASRWVYHSCSSPSYDGEWNTGRALPPLLQRHFR